MWDVLCALTAVLYKCQICFQTCSELGGRGSSLRLGLHTHGEGTECAEARALGSSIPGSPAEEAVGVCSSFSTCFPDLSRREVGPRGPEVRVWSLD